jgi:predicted nucleic acid-binding protein
MDRVFLDTNYFVGLANRAPEPEAIYIHKQQAFISILSCHILFYINKIVVPDYKINSFISDFNIINLDSKILDRALYGPTKDLEDNIQLQSAIDANCNYFLTFDKKLLNMKVFGNTKITNKLT